jgi:hypothetical protein
MTIIQRIYALSIIARVAKQQGISTSQCRAAIQEAIDQIRPVGEERTPTPEEFILLVSTLLP